MGDRVRAAQLMDLRMPEMDGVEATREIVSRGLARFAVLTTYTDDQSMFPALRAGASGYRPPHSVVIKRTPSR